jgi:hypothetical protein
MELRWHLHHQSLLSTLANADLSSRALGRADRDASNAKFVIVAEAEQPGAFEVECGVDEIIVWAWSGSIARVFSDGKEVGDFAGLERPAVPEIP